MAAPGSDAGSSYVTELAPYVVAGAALIALPLVLTAELVDRIRQRTRKPDPDPRDEVLRMIKHHRDHPCR